MKTALNMINGPLAKWLPLGLTAVLACGCNSVYMNFDYDDIYGHAPSRNQERQMLSKAARGQSDAQSVENAYYYDEETGEYYLYENDTAAYEYPAFDYDNYYDYEYSSRLKRFHQDDYITDDYYDDYYTNTYWYDQNPYSYGTSIYLGYNNWVPSFTVYGGGWSLGLSYGYDPFWYRSYRYWPSYSYWDWGWPGYWGPGYWHGWGWGSGYWNGYWDGYHDGFWGNHWACNDYFYNSFDKNTYYKQEIRRGHSNAGSGSGGNSQPLVVRRGGSTTGGTGGAACITTGTGSLRGSGTGGTGGTGSSSQRRVSPSFGERYQAAVRQEQRVSADKDGNLRNNGGVSTNPVRPTQRTSNGQTVRTQTGASGTVRLNESVGKENSTTAPQRTVSPTTPQRTTPPQRSTTAPQRTVNPNTPQRTTRTNS
ncbi:MAG: hypothetical protein K2O01_07535, partial [Bacteroidales bacterium]|nr:hypothetical protein [Bacteroidales bacterium]